MKYILTSLLIGLTLSSEITLAGDCSQVKTRLKCSSYSYKANPKEVKYEHAKTVIADYELVNTGEDSESYCEAKLDLDDTVYGLKLSAFVTDNVVTLVVNKVDDSAKATTTIGLVLGQTVYTSLVFKTPLVGIGADVGYHISETTLSCELISKK